MNRMTGFMHALLMAIITASSMILGSPPVNAQVVDDAPARLIQRLADNPGEFWSIVTSDDGQVIAAYTTGPLHLAGLPPFTSFTAQVVVIDRRNGTVELASRTPSGGFQNFSNLPGLPFGPDSGPLSISRDGRFVAFVSSATNLDPAASTPGQYTFLYDRAAGQVRVLTADELNRPGWRGASGVIDGGATRVVFRCRSLANLPVGGNEFAFCERRLSDFAVRVVRRGFLGTNDEGGLQLSRDGRSIAFAYYGPILTTGAPNPNRVPQLYLIDVETGGVELVSRASDGSPGNGFSGSNSYFSMSDDADFVAYETTSTNIAQGPLSPGTKIIVTQRSTGITRRASSINELGTVAPHLSGDGRRLVYLDYAFYFTRDIVRVYDWETDTNRAVARPASGPPNQLPCRAALFFQAPPRDLWQSFGISADGRALVFASLATNFFPGDMPFTCDLFVQTLGAIPQPSTPVPGPSPMWLSLLAALLILVGIAAMRRIH